MSTGIDVAGFGALEGLIGVKQLEAQRRQARQNAFNEDAKVLNGQQLAARTAGRLIGEAFARLGPDTQKDRARIVDEALATARQQTGFEVSGEAAAQIEEQARQADVGEARQTAETKQTQANPGGLSNPYEQDVALLESTIQEMSKRGLFTEATMLAGQLKAAKKASFEHMQEVLKYQQDVHDLKADENGESVTVQLRGGADTFQAQRLIDGTIRWYDPATGAWKTARPGEYIEAKLQGTAKDFSDTERAKQIQRLKQVGQTLNLMGSLREDIRNTPNANTWTGTLLGAIGDALPDMKTIARTIGDKDTWAQNQTLFNKRFEDLAQEYGIQNNMQRIKIERLAYSLAASREGGKLSESDVLFAMNVFGGNIKNDEIRLAVIDDAFKEISKGLEFDQLTLDEGTRGSDFFQDVLNTRDQYQSLMDTHGTYKRSDTRGVLGGGDGSAGGGNRPASGTGNALHTTDSGAEVY